MQKTINRRGVIKSALAAGLGLAVPTRLFGQDAAKPAGDADFGKLFAQLGGDRLAATASGNTAYERRVLEIAAREVERHGNVLWHRDKVGVADFARPSSLPRLHFADLQSGTVRSFLVAHGRGSDHEHDGWLKSFSNTVGSEATSRGGYLTCEWYDGKYGTSIRLQGLEGDNSNAHERAIVVHPAWYAAPDMLEKYGKLGRSEGCFAMAPEQFNEVLWSLSGGRLLFADRIGEG